MKRTNDEIMKDFLDLVGALSPENLYQDGLATSSEFEESLNSIESGWKKLEQEIGHKVTHSDAWDWWDEQKQKLEPVTPPPLKKKTKNFFGV